MTFKKNYQNKIKKYNKNQFYLKLADSGASAEQFFS